MTHSGNGLSWFFSFELNWSKMVIWSKTRITALLSSFGEKCQALAFVAAKPQQTGLLSVASHVIYWYSTLLSMIPICSLAFSVVWLKHFYWSGGKGEAGAKLWSYRVCVPPVSQNSPPMCLLEKHSKFPVGVAAAFSLLTLGSLNLLLIKSWVHVPDKMDEEYIFS